MAIRCPNFQTLYSLLDAAMDLALLVCLIDAFDALYFLGMQHAILRQRQMCSYFTVSDTPQSPGTKIHVPDCSITGFSWYFPALSPTTPSFSWVSQQAI